MKFSIISLLVLTLWVALAIQIIFGWSRASRLEQQQTVANKEARSIIRQTGYIEASLDPGESLDTMQCDIEQLGVIQQGLAEVFDSASALVSDVVPQKDMVSIRTLPMFNLAGNHCGKQKIYVPDSRKIFLNVELEPKVNDTSVQTNTELECDPDESVAILIEPGMHVIQWSYQYQDERGTFVLLLDEQEKCRFTWNNFVQHSMSSSGPSFEKQRDFASGKFKSNAFKVANVSVGGTGATVRVTLSEPED